MCQSGKFQSRRCVTVGALLLPPPCLAPRLNRMNLVDPNYVDPGALRSQDNVPLANYLDQDDRARPDLLRGMPFFSGREAEVRTFRHMVNTIFRGKTANTTIAVEGPPGAGKSALLCQFAEELRTLPPVSERRWLPVLMGGGEALAPQDVMLAVDDAIAVRPAHDALNAPSSQLRGPEGRPLLSFSAMSASTTSSPSRRALLTEGARRSGSAFVAGRAMSPHRCVRLQTCAARLGGVGRLS